jgi:hypothetical protein
MPPAYLALRIAAVTNPPIPPPWPPDDPEKMLMVMAGILKRM